MPSPAAYLLSSSRRLAAGAFSNRVQNCQAFKRLIDVATSSHSIPNMGLSILGPRILQSLSGFGPDICPLILLLAVASVLTRGRRIHHSCCALAAVPGLATYLTCMCDLIATKCSLGQLDRWDQAVSFMKKTGNGDIATMNI